MVSRKSPVSGPRSKQHGKLLQSFATFKRIFGFTKLWPNAYVHPDYNSQPRQLTYCCSIVSTPFSYSCKKTPKDAEDQLEAISGAAFAMKKSHGTQYTVCTMSSFTVVVGHAECPRREHCVRHYIGQSSEQYSGNRGVFTQSVSLSQGPPGT